MDLKLVFIAVQTSIFVASIFFWWTRIGVMRRKGALLADRPHDVSPVGVFDISAIVFVWFTFQILSLVPVFFFMGLTPNELNDLGSLPADKMLEFTGWVQLMQLAATAAAIAWLTLRHRRVQWLGSVSGMKRDLLVGLTGSILIIPFVWLIQLVATQYVEYTHPTLDSLVENFSFRTAIWAWIAAVGVAPITEEFFFRGIIQGWLQRVFDYDEPIEKRLIGGPADSKLARDSGQESGPQKWLRFWMPILITSFVFAGIHFGQGPAPIPLFFLSLGIGYLFRKTGSLIPCFVVHLVLNSIAMVILTLSIIYPELQPPVEVEPVPAMFFETFGW